jgi:glycosyltransferase involved in cell wall biosynthesis
MADQGLIIVEASTAHRGWGRHLTKRAKDARAPAERRFASKKADSAARRPLESQPVSRDRKQHTLRVRVLTPSFPPTPGGQEDHLLALAAALQRGGAQVEVLTRRERREIPRTERLEGVRVRRFAPYGAIKGVGIRAAPRLGLLLAKLCVGLVLESRRYDVVLVSGINFMPWVPVAAGFLTGKPCVVRPESPQEIKEPVGGRSRARMRLGEGSLPIRLIGAIRRGALRRIDRFIAISDEIRQGLESLGVPPTRIASVPNGIEVERYAPATAAEKAALRAELALPGEAVLLIYTGRLALSKGLMMLIDVWRELAPAFPGAHLLIVGTGRGSFDDCESELKDFIATHSLGSRVTLTGSVREVSKYLQASDLFVFPSDYEGFSLSLLEAMTAGLPLASTRVGIAAELEREAQFGLLVPPKDRAALCAAVRTLLSDPALRAELGRTARRTVRERYSIDAEAARYLEIFRELVGGAAR